MHAKNILHLGVKEFWSLARDPMMLILIVYAFTASIYSTASALPDSLHNAPIAIVDEDQSALSQRIVNAFQPPLFVPPKLVSPGEMDARMDAGLDTFALNIPPNFQQDVLAGRSPRIQLNTDATRVGQAFSGSGYVQTIVNGEVQTFLQRYRANMKAPVEVEERLRFNPNLIRSRFGAVVALIDMITMLSVLLTGAALIRERERGTVEHLLVMPVTPFEIMTSKIWSMGLVVLVASAVSMIVVVRGSAEGPDSGFARPVPLRRGAARGRGHVAGNVPGHLRPHHAAVLPADDHGAAPVADALRRHDPAREHARVGPADHAWSPHHSHRDALPGHPVPRCGSERRLAAISRARGHRLRSLRRRAVPLPQDDWIDVM